MFCEKVRQMKVITKCDGLKRIKGEKKEIKGRKMMKGEWQD